MIAAAHLDNRRAKAARLAQLLFANSICAERWKSATPYQLSLIEEMDRRLTRRKRTEPISDATHRETLAELEKLERADFTRRLKEMRRFCRNEQRRPDRAKENL